MYSYGGPSARVNGSVAFDLHRMNRVLEVSDDFSYAVVEPGVSFKELGDYCSLHGKKVWPSTPSLGWGSVTGNVSIHSNLVDSHGFCVLTRVPSGRLWTVVPASALIPPITNQLPGLRCCSLMEMSYVRDNSASPARPRPSCLNLLSVRRLRVSSCRATWASSPSSASG